MISEVNTLILKKSPTDIRFREKIENHDGKGYFFATNIYKGENYTAILFPNKRNIEGKADVHPEGTTANKQ